jgi:hypothetical protein
MNAIETQPSGSSPASRPQFTAALLLTQRAAVSFAQFRSELKLIAPDAGLGDWSGPVTDPAADPGVEMLNLNGERLSVLVVGGPAPASMLQAGPFPNPLWPNAEKEAAEHRAYILVVAPEDPPDREAAVAKARAVTLLAAALARIVPATGVTWIDSVNLVKAAAFVGITEKLGQPEANAVPFWVRLMVTKSAPASAGGPTLTAGTLGLRIFGLRELEYAPAALDPGFILQHAYSVSEYLLRSGKRLGDGESIGVDGQAGFAIAHAEKAILVRFQLPASTFSPRHNETGVRHGLQF